MSKANSELPSDCATVLALHEESVAVGKRRRTTGRVRIATEPTTRVESLRHELLGEEVEIERVPMDQIVTEPPQVRQEGEVTVVPVIEEVLFVEKRLVLREEVRIRRKTVATSVEEAVTLRGERLAIEREAVPASSPIPTTQKE